MKSTAIAAAVLFLLATGTQTALAQTRHDEKPHGMAKPAEGKGEAAVPGLPGRHDEKPHGPPKKAKKAPAEKAAKADGEAAKGGK